MHDLVKVRQKYHHHKNDAKRRGIEFLFTFDEWWEWWRTDDRWSRRGRGKGKFVMARHGDTGPYHPDNVRCATYEENNAEVSREVKSLAGYKSNATKKLRGTQTLNVRGSGHPRSRAVITPAGRFESGWLAAEHHGISRNGLYYRIKAGWPGYKWERHTNRETLGKTKPESAEL